MVKAKFRRKWTSILRDRGHFWNEIDGSEWENVSECEREWNYVTRHDHQIPQRPRNLRSKIHRKRCVSTILHFPSLLINEYYSWCNPNQLQVSVFIFIYRLINHALISIRPILQCLYIHYLIDYYLNIKSFLNIDLLTNESSNLPIKSFFI